MGNIKNNGYTAEVAQTKAQTRNEQLSPQAPQFDIKTKISTPTENTQFSVFVNSTDHYSDTWEPFFTLFKKFWPEYQGKIYLNTEEKVFEFPGLDIVSTQVARFKSKDKLTWGQCLLYGFNQVETDLVFYTHEDYFLKAPVQHDKILEWVTLMQAHQITYLNISDQGNRGPFHPSDLHHDLWAVDQKDQYRISTQASLWDIQKMRRYVRKHENPWHFEFYGNIRARRRRDRFYAVNRDQYNHHSNDVWPYDPTGIVAGKWVKEIVYDLFKENNIQIDFEQRGFYDPNTSQRRYKKKPLYKKLISAMKSLI